VHFRRTVGSTAFDYLTDWRIGLPQTLLEEKTFENRGSIGRLRQFNGSFARILEGSELPPPSG
jgi:hypothetical protein